MRKNTRERRKEQLYALYGLLERHSEDYFIQVNVCAPNASEHVCVGIPHDSAELIVEMVREFLNEETR